MALQHVSLVAAVADLVPDVKSGALLHAVEQLAWISTGVAWEGCGAEVTRRKKTVGEKIVLYNC